MLVIILGIGLIPALILSWVFEFTPEGLKLESDIDRSQPIDKDKGKTFDRVVMAVLALALAYFAFDKFILAESRMETARQEGRSQALTESYGDKSIAVLSFVDMSPDKDQEYMSDGIAEELLNLLAKIPELRVISRSSAFSFKGKDLDIPTIAEQLNVAHILEGSIRKAGDRIRITTQLIEGRSDTHLWSETYDRVLDDIFGIQDEIAQKVVDELKFTLLDDIPQASQTDPEAYEQYLLGQHLMHERTKASIEAAAQHFQNAIDIDADYAPAHAAFAIASILLMNSSMTYGDFSLEEAIGRALPAAQRALEINPKLAEAHAALGFMHYRKLEFDDALLAYDKALEANPNYAMVYSWQGIVLRETGSYQKYFETTAKAAELDPLSVSALNNQVAALFAQGRYDERDKVALRMKAISPPNYFYMTSWQAWQSGNPADALFALLDGLDFEPENRRIPGGLANMFGLMGVHEESVRHAPASVNWLPFMWIADFETMVRLAREDYASNPNNRSFKVQLGLSLLAAGEVDEAMQILESYLTSLDDGVGASVSIAMYIALHRQANNDVAGVDHILKELKARLRKSNDGGINDTGAARLRAAIGLLEGRESDALDGFESLSKRSGIEPRDVASLRALTSLVDEPRFIEILDAQAKRWATQREKMMARVCGDENWVEWDPLPGTCTGQHPVD